MSEEYREMPEVGGIAHTHSPYATAWAARAEVIPCVLTAMADEFGGPIPVGPFALIGGEGIGQGIVATLTGHRSPAVLMRSHGVFTIGATARDAIKAAVMCEDIAQTVHLARVLGNPVPLAPEEIDALYDRYLMIAEGGTERGHGVSIARGPRPDGPFEGCPQNTVLSARSTSWPVQNTGHGDLVRTPRGGWAMVLLGVRARGMTQGFSPMGRETLITTVEWVDGWPVVGSLDTITGTDPVVHEEAFDAPALGLEWVSVRTPAAEWSSTRERPGALVIHGDRSCMDDPRPRFVGRRQQHTAAAFSAQVDPGDGVGGLSLRIDEDHHYDVEIAAGVARARGRVGPFCQTWGQPIPPGPVTLRIDVRPTGGSAGLDMAPDLVHLSVVSGSGPLELAALDGRYVSAETAAAFTGRVLGMYAAEGSVAFHAVRYEGRDDAPLPLPRELAMSGGTP